MEKIKENELKNQEKCKEHPLEIGSHFCLKCNEIICTKCRITHKNLGHQVETCEDAATDFINEQKGASQKINEEKNHEELIVKQFFIKATIKFRELIKKFEKELQLSFKKYATKKFEKNNESQKNNYLNKLYINKKYKEICIYYANKKGVNENKNEMAKDYEKIYIDKLIFSKLDWELQNFVDSFKNIQKEFENQIRKTNNEGESSENKEENKDIVKKEIKKQAKKEGKKSNYKAINPEVIENALYIRMIEAEGPTLDLQYWSMKQNDLIAISEALKENQKIINLDISGYYYGYKGIQAIAEAIQLNPDFNELIATLPNIEPIGVGAITDIICVSNSISKIDFSQTHIGDEIAAKIAHSLKTNHTLTWLSLRVTYIKIKGVLFIAEALKENDTLQYLDIGQLDIKDEGAAKIGESLKINKALKHLDISYGQICEFGEIEIANSLKINNTLKELYMYGNWLNYTVLEKFIEALCLNKSLILLSILTQNEKYLAGFEFIKLYKTKDFKIN